MTNKLIALGIVLGLTLSAAAIAEPSKSTKPSKHRALKTFIVLNQKYTSVAGCVAGQGPSADKIRAQRICTNAWKATEPAAE